MFSWFKQFFTKAIRRDLVNEVFQQAGGFIAATDLMHSIHDIDLVISMQRGGDHFDDRLAILHGICSHKYQDRDLSDREYRAVLSMLLQAENARAGKRGYAGELGELTNRLTEVMQTERGQLLSGALCDVLAKLPTWEEDKAKEVQGKLWRRLIDGVERELE